MMFLDLAAQCAPDVSPQTMAAIVTVESSHNPYAIGVVNGRLKRQPRSLQEAVATVQMLEAQGRNYSMGLAQVNKQHLKRFGLTLETVFHPCSNLRAGATILRECYVRASRQGMPDQAALQAAFSCYYSGNFRRGFRPDPGHSLSYVEKVWRASGNRNAVARSVTVPPATSVATVNPSGAMTYLAQGAESAVTVKRVRAVAESSDVFVVAQAKAAQRMDEMAKHAKSDPGVTSAFPVLATSVVAF